MNRIMLTAAAAAVLAAAPASAQSFSYDGFADTTGLQINGNAATATDAQNRSVLRLTPADFAQAGSAFSTTQIQLGADASFSTAFTFNINTNLQGGLGSADGFVFVVQPNSSTVGGSGAGIGYAGIANSLGIEFDTFQNSGDPAEDHIGINLDGSVSSLATYSYAPGFDTGQDLFAFIDYNGGTQELQVRISATNARPADAVLTLSDLNLATVLGTSSAFVGFTSGTGSGYSNHDIVNWRFNNSFAPIDPGAVPEPATWGLMLAGFGLVGGSIRRRRARVAIA